MKRIEILKKCFLLAKESAGLNPEINEDAEGPILDAMEEYAKSTLKEIMPTDEEITEQAELHFDKHTIACRTWIGGAKWRKSEIEKRNK